MSQIIMFSWGVDMEFPDRVDGAEGNGGKSWYQEGGNVIKMYLYGQRKWKWSRSVVSNW